MRLDVTVFALVVVVIGVLIGASKVWSDQYLAEEKVCGQAIAHAFQFSQETSADSIHAGVWHIVRRNDLDDDQKYAMIMVYHTIQQISWAVRYNPELAGGDLEKFWVGMLNRAHMECEYFLNELRFPDIDLK